MGSGLKRGKRDDVGDPAVVEALRCQFHAATSVLRGWGAKRGRTAVYGRGQITSEGMDVESPGQPMIPMLLGKSPMPCNKSGIQESFFAEG